MFFYLPVRPLLRVTKMCVLSGKRKKSGKSRLLGVWLGTSAVALTPMVLSVPAWGEEPLPQVRALESAVGGEAGTESAVPDGAATASAETQAVDIWEYRISGSELLSQEDVERAVYPYLGPGKTAGDVEAARAALEKAYAERGFQTVAVSIPAQQVTKGVVTLAVTEGKVGRLRVRGSHYYDIEAIKKTASSLAEGTVPDFNAVSEDIVALNQQPDRRITPALRAGATPGTVDVDLTVEDTFPLHGSLELNNRYSQDTSKLRLNGSLRYDNLWQLGHSFNLGYQVAPENSKDSEVYSASYLARFASLPRLSLLGYWVDQDSDINTLGSMNVAGKGSIVGLRAIATLPGGSEGYFHTLSVGFDRKRFQERVTLGSEDAYTAPITYYPVTAVWSGTWQGDGRETQANAGVTFNFRPSSSDWQEFDAKRYKSGGSFIYFRGDVAHSEELPYGAQGWAKVQAQLSNDPLISSEQFSAGGLDTVRGYLESEVLGDNAFLGSLELRSPSLAPGLGEIVDEWRFHLFVDGGHVSIKEALEEQEDSFSLWSYGIGTRFRLLEYLNSSVDVGVPMITQGDSKRGDPQATFRVWGEF